VAPGQGFRVTGAADANPQDWGRANYLLRNGHQSVPPEPLSEAKTWVVRIEVEPDEEPAKAAFAEAATAAITTTVASASMVVRCLSATGSLLLSDPNALISAH
jgi:hypothetical protein